MRAKTDGSSHISAPLGIQRICPVHLPGPLGLSEFMVLLIY